MEIRDLETRGPLVASERSENATAQGPRVSKSRISMDLPYNLYFLSGLITLIGTVLPEMSFSCLGSPENAVVFTVTWSASMDVDCWLC